MKRLATFGVVAVLAAALSGCLSGPNQRAGTVTGAVAGGVLGGVFGKSAGAAAAGAVVGGLVGNAVGASLDARDRKMAEDAEYRALEFGHPGVPIEWHGRKGNGSVVAGPPYQVNDYNCRDYTHTIYTGGQPEVARGTACRQTDGTWKPVG